MLKKLKNIKDTILFYLKKMIWTSFKKEKILFYLKKMIWTNFKKEKIFFLINLISDMSIYLNIQYL